MEEIVNKIAASGLITLDPADYLPGEIEVFDLKPFLFRELILKEKDFREALKSHDWTQYRGKAVTLTCSTDAIIPMWAYMLITSYLQPYATRIGYGNKEEMIRQVTLFNIEQINIDEFRDQRIVLKGCGEKPVPADAYIALMKKLQPVVKSLMFGEPCSTVPVYKQKKA